MGVRCYFLGVALLFFAASPVICGVDAAADKKKGGGFLGRVVSSGRKLLQLGVTDDSRLVPPIFVDWADPGTQPSLPFAGRYDCQDRGDWAFTWPTTTPFLPPSPGQTLDGILCDEYAEGGLGEGMCDLDYGLAVWSAEWMSASDACPRSCRQCCSLFCKQKGGWFDSSSNYIPGVDGCETACLSFQPNARDPFYSYLLFAEDQDSAYRQLRPAESYFNYTNNFTTSGYPDPPSPSSLSTLLELGGQFLSSRYISMYHSQSHGSEIRFTTDGSEPSPTHGTVGRNVTVYLNTIVKAVAYTPGEGATTASTVASLEVLVQAPPPVIKVETCLLPSGQLLNYSSSSSSYAGEECREAIVLIAAVDTLDPASLQFSPTPIYFTLDGTAPSNLATDPPPIPAGYGIVRVRLGKSAQVTAVAARGHAMVPSEAVSLPGGGVTVGAGLYTPSSFRRTVGLWELGDVAAFGGAFSRAKIADGGSCTEQYATLIDPSDVPNLAHDAVPAAFGPARLLGPECKGGKWDVSTSPPGGPNLDTLEMDGGRGLSMGGLNPGLVVNDDLAALKGSGMLPDAQIAVEVWCSFDRPVPPSGDDGRIFGGLVGARMDKGGVKGQLFGRGWGLGYEHDIERNETIVSFSLSLAGTDGTMHTLGAHISPIPSPGEMFHIVGMYDGSQVSIYVDGQLYSSSNPCGESTPCGGILNPVAADSFYTEGQKTRLTLGVVYNGRRGTSELHRGAMRMVRIMKEAMSPLEISAAADRFEYDLSSDPCPPGFYGPYEGRQPCFPCEAGRAQHLQGALSCDLCSLGYFSPGTAALQCEKCAPGTASVPARDACSADPCAQGIADPCPGNATCAPQGGCECMEGFSEDGVTGQCNAVCGDGIIVSGEECDDGGGIAGDGCSPSCQLESANFTCPEEGGACTCDVVNNTAFCCTRGHAVCLQMADPARDCIREYAACLRSSKPPPASRDALPYCDVDASRNCGQEAARCASLSPPPHGGCARVVGQCLKAVSCREWQPETPAPTPAGNITDVNATDSGPPPDDTPVPPAK